MLDTPGNLAAPAPPYSEAPQMALIKSRHNTPARMTNAPALTPSLPELEKFRDNLVQGMMNKNMSASDVARAVWGSKTNSKGASVARNRDRMTHYLAGKAYPRPETVIKLAEVLGLDPSDLEREMYKTAASPEGATVLSRVAHHARSAEARPTPGEPPEEFTFSVRGARRVFISFNKEVDLDVAMKLFDAIRAIVPDFVSEEAPED